MTKPKGRGASAEKYMIKNFPYRREFKNFFMLKLNDKNKFLNELKRKRYKTEKDYALLRLYLI
tara:strand:- start:317 stop:505 length:189 start_codon:yes stop_codon:yes gene_type:complete